MLGLQRGFRFIYGEQHRRYGSRGRLPSGGNDAGAKNLRDGAMDDDGIARLWRRDEDLVSFCTTCCGMFRVFERIRMAAAATIILNDNTKQPSDQLRRN